MSSNIVQIYEPDFSRFNSVLINDGCILNDINYINRVTEQESSLVGRHLINSSPSFEFEEGQDIPDDIFDSFMPSNIDGIDEISDYLYYNSKRK